MSGGFRRGILRRASKTRYSFASRYRKVPYKSQYRRVVDSILKGSRRYITKANIRRVTEAGKFVYRAGKLAANAYGTYLSSRPGSFNLLSNAEVKYLSEDEGDFQNAVEYVNPSWTYLETAFDFDSTNGTQFFKWIPISILPQGVTRKSRIGETVRFVGLELEFVINTNNWISVSYPDLWLTVCLVCDKDPNNPENSVNNLDSETDIIFRDETKVPMLLQRHDHKYREEDKDFRGRFRILAMKHYHNRPAYMSTNYTSASGPQWLKPPTYPSDLYKKVRFNIPLDVKVTYNGAGGAVSDIQENALWLGWKNSFDNTAGVTPMPTIDNFRARLFFVDN